MDVVVVLGLAVAAVAAVRGVWSPCGLSMLSSITPMTEAGRGNRFGVTAAWFQIGGVVGGMSLGLVAAAGAALVHALDPSRSALLAVGGAIAVVTAAIDLGIVGIELPIFKRQVNDAWLRTYRSWVYGAGFGWQIGAGVATYIMTAGVFLAIALAVLSADPLAAMAICTTFGLVRGSAVYIGRNASTPSALGRVHARLDDWAGASRSVAAWVQVLAAAVLVGAAWHPVAGAAVAAAALASNVLVLRSQHADAAQA